MGYWAVVRKRAWEEALKAAKLDTWSGRAVILVAAVGPAIITWLALGDATGPLVRALASLGSTALLAIGFFFLHMLRVPPAIDAEKDQQLALLSVALEKAETEKAKPVPAPIDLAKVSNLLTLWGDKCLKMRSKHGMQPNAQRLWARDLLTDITALYGQESAYIATRRFPHLLDEGTSGAIMDGYMRQWAADIADMQKNLTPERISREVHPDIMAYVDTRLVQLRAELGFTLPA